MVRYRWLHGFFIRRLLLDGESLIGIIIYQHMPFLTDSILTQHLITIADGELLVVSSDDDKELTDDVAIKEDVKVGETPLRQQAQNGRR